MQDKPEIRVIRADFGDGYSQTTADLNNIRRVVTATWDVLTREERDEILSFFRARGGYAPFYWRIPGEADPVKFTVEEWSDTAIRGGYWSITATFRQSWTLAS